MPGLVKTNVGSGDQRWLASAHALGNARSGVLDVSTFAAGDRPNGFYPSGTELNVADESAITPWTGGAGERLGYLKEDTSVLPDGEDLNVAYLWHGAINVEYVPGGHTEPAAETPGSTNGFTFIEGSDD